MRMPFWYFTLVAVGCKSQNIEKHNGIYCQIMDWKKKKKLKFVNIIGGKKSEKV